MDCFGFDFRRFTRSTAVRPAMPEGVPWAYKRFTAWLDAHRHGPDLQVIHEVRLYLLQSTRQKSLSRRMAAKIHRHLGAIEVHLHFDVDVEAFFYGHNAMDNAGPCLDTYPSRYI